MNSKDKSIRKIVRSPSSVLNQYVIDFSLYEKVNVVDSYSHPWIYNFFSLRASLLFICKSRRGKYSFRGYVPPSCKLPYVYEHHTLYDVFFESDRYLDCVSEFTRSVRHVLNFYDCVSEEFCEDVLF